MAPKRKPVSRSTRRRNNQNSFWDACKRFIKTLSVTATLTFGAASCALNPQLRDHFSIDELLAQFELKQADTAPVAAKVDGYAQTRFADCPHFFPKQQPPIVPSARALRELCFSAFAILHSGNTKTPVFVAQRLNRSMIQQTQHIKRNDRFYAESRLPQAERAQLDDYRNSGFSRGHMAPAGDMHTDEAMAQSFSLANMVPQIQQHNAGAWSKIESDTRKYILRASGDVYVFTGPVYSGAAQSIGAGRVAIPHYLFKLVYDTTTGRSWVHWHEHSATTRAGAPISYDEFVRRTGLHLLPHLQQAN